MKKTNLELIQDYRKSNYARRLRIAELNGFKTGEEYFTSLMRSDKKSSAAKVVVKKPASPKKEKLDYIVAFDTTGSMYSYLKSVRNHIKNLIPEMFSQDIDLRMKIIAFGDYCDMTSSKVFGKAYQESEFTDNQNELIAFTEKAKETSGGDGDEFYELVVKKITEETPWREGAKKAVLLIADYTPHPVGYSYPGIVNNSQIDWKVEAGKAAKLGVSFDTLSIVEYLSQWYKELSQITGGIHMPFKSSNKMSEVMSASAYVRGSTTSKAKFNASYRMAVNSGDEELIGTYKSLSTLL